MNKLTEMINLKAAIAGVVALTTLSTLVPNTAQAFPFGSKKKPDALGIQFKLGNSNNDSFSNAISEFAINSDDIGILETVAKAEKSFGLNKPDVFKRGTKPDPINNFDFDYDINGLPSSPCSGDNLIVEGILFPSCFSNIDTNTAIYKFSFQIDPDAITVVSGTSSVEDLLQGTSAISENNEVTWYVPSKFTYKVETGEFFDIDFTNDNPFLTLNKNSLGEIFESAREKGIDTVFFPAEFQEFQDTSLIGFATQSQSVTQKTTPESDTLVSLLALGVIGGLTYQKSRLE